MSLRDRAKAAARERGRQQAKSGPGELQTWAAADLSEILECEVDPAAITTYAENIYTYFEAPVDGVPFRVCKRHDGNDIGWTTIAFEAETGHRALRRWRRFESLADLDALLD